MSVDDAEQRARQREEDEWAIKEDARRFDRPIKGYEFDCVTKELMQRLDALDDECKKLKNDQVWLGHELNDLKNWKLRREMSLR